MYGLKACQLLLLTRQIIVSKLGRYKTFIHLELYLTGHDVFTVYLTEFRFQILSDSTKPTLSLHRCACQFMLKGAVKRWLDLLIYLISKCSAPSNKKNLSFVFQNIYQAAHRV